MSIAKILAQIHKELGTVLKGVDEKPVERLLDAVLAVEKVYLAGQGRSGLMARAFAMRLMHLGLTSFVAGETVTPAFMKDDLMIACSGSGETKITLHLAESAKECGGQLAAVIANPKSTLAQMADIVVVLPCGEFGANKQWTRSIQFGRALFEQACLLLYDAMVLRLAERLGKKGQDILQRHTNLE
jgi:6-phospho-3-hexuloisomerase